jgi:hypothetical protein
LAPPPAGQSSIPKLRALLYFIPCLLTRARKCRETGQLEELVPDADGVQHLRHRVELYSILLAATVSRSNQLLALFECINPILSKASAAGVTHYRWADPVAGVISATHIFNKSQAASNRQCK